MKKNRLSNFDRPIGVWADTGIIYLFYATGNARGSCIRVEISTDGLNFSKFKENVYIFDERGKKVSTKDISLVNVSLDFDNYFLTFKTTAHGKSALRGARGRDFSRFKMLGKIRDIGEGGVLVPSYKNKGYYVLYWGESSIKVAYSVDQKQWLKGKTILKPQRDFFGDAPLRVGNAIITDEGILLVYLVKRAKNHINHFEIRAVVLDRENPQIIKRYIDHAVWASPEEWANKKISLLGIVKVGESLVSYWAGDEGVFSVFHPYLLVDKGQDKFPLVILQKLRHNPIIRPIIENFWESKATFNPAAVYDEGKVHIIYRAIGEDDVSVLGYASSYDGFNIDQRLNTPIYVPTQPFELSGDLRGSFNNSPFASGGGGMGGCEDPRITKLDGRLYMTYVAYNGFMPPRVAITSINAQDFLDHRWNWEKPVLISKPGVVDKNACLLPEKINGKYVIFHRIFPNILVDFVDDLNFGENKYLDGEFSICPREKYWDSRKIGVGAPPIKTNDGWLLIYQAVGEVDPGRYKVGAMLLDLQDPTRVLARSNEPILEPDVWYENDGFKSGVAYPCGAVKIGKKLIVYYGGADTVVCAASSNLEEFVNNLKYHRALSLTPSSVHHIN